MRPQGRLVYLGELNQYIRPKEVLKLNFEQQYGVPLDGLLPVKEIVGLGTHTDWKKQENPGNRPTFKMGILRSYKIQTDLVYFL